MAIAPPQCGQSHSGRGVSAGVASVVVRVESVVVRESPICPRSAKQRVDAKCARPRVVRLFPAETLVQAHEIAFV